MKKFFLGIVLIGGLMSFVNAMEQEEPWFWNPNQEKEHRERQKSPLHLSEEDFAKLLQGEQEGTGEAHKRDGEDDR